MSFGWSAGDIVAALNLLHKVAVALKDAGGAAADFQEVSSFLNVLTITLQHLKALQAIPLDLDLAKNLRDLCEQVEGPLTSFCERIGTSFERDLGADSTRLKVLTAGRKLQWALSTSKKVKDLREKIGGSIAAIGVVLSQQLVQTTLQMPAEIQARIAHTIDNAVDTRLGPQTVAVQNAVTALSKAQENSSQLIEGTIRIAEKNIETEIRKHSQKITLDLENKFNALTISHTACAESIVKIKDQSQSTDLVLRTVLQTGQDTAHAIQKHNLISQRQTSSLDKKLDRINSLVGIVENRMNDLSIAQRSAGLSESNSEIRGALSTIHRSVWLLLSALQVLLRELIFLLMPYLIAIYRISVQPLLLCGDHFLFEDAIGRRKWLPCLQFQHWKTFYNFLIDSFQGEAGLPRVLNGQFVMLNAFNEVPISKKMWRAGIQPKSRVSMAIMLEGVKKGRCANPLCPGVVEFRTNDVTRICPICGKHLSNLMDSITENEEKGSEAGFTFEFGSNIQIPILSTGIDKQHRLNKAAPTPPKFRFQSKVIDKDIAAYKRVIWQHSDENDSETNDVSELFKKSFRHLEKRPNRRPRDVRARHKPASTLARNFNYSSSDKQELPIIVEENQKSPAQERNIGGNYDKLQDYEIHIMLLEQQNRRRHQLANQTENQKLLEPQRQQERMIERPRSPKSYRVNNINFQDYQAELMLLNQQNREILQLARHKQDTVNESTEPPK